MTSRASSRSRRPIARSTRSQLNQGESATIVVQSLNNDNVAFTLLDDDGDVLGLQQPDASNYTAGLNNFVAPTTAPTMWR